VRRGGAEVVVILTIDDQDWNGRSGKVPERKRENEQKLEVHIRSLHSNVMVWKRNQCAVIFSARSNLVRVCHPRSDVPWPRARRARRDRGISDLRLWRCYGRSWC